MSAGNDRILARALVSAMNDDVGQPPEEVLARVLGETEQARPLPRLVALVVEPPIVMPARVVVGIRRSRLLMVAAALLIATTFVAIRDRRGLGRAPHGAEQAPGCARATAVARNRADRGVPGRRC